MTPTKTAPPGRRGRLTPLLLVAGSLLIVLAILSTTFLIRLFSVPSGSNVPTLLVGDTVVTSKLAYGLSRYSLPIDLGFKGRIFGHAPARGDIAFFALPRDPTIVYAKRVIGLPGDTIQMKQGRLFINGTIVPREPLPEVEAENYEGVETKVPTYKETLPGGVSYSIIEIQGDTGFNDNTDAFKVPPNAYFVMGDNRDNSLDSRVPPDQGGVGYVPFDNFIARGEYVLFNARRSGRTMIPIR